MILNSHEFSYNHTMVRSRRHKEDFIFADIDPNVQDKAWGVGKSLWSAREFGEHLRKIVG